MIVDVGWLRIADDLESRIYPVGRLDYDTSGVLLCNDGEFTNLMTHPRYHIKKCVAKLKGYLMREKLSNEKGIELEDGYKPAQVKIKSKIKEKYDFS